MARGLSLWLSHGAGVFGGGLLRAVVFGGSLTAAFFPPPQFCDDLVPFGVGDGYGVGHHVRLHSVTVPGHGLCEGVTLFSAGLGRVEATRKPAEITRVQFSFVKATKRD